MTRVEFNPRRRRFVQSVSAMVPLSMGLGLRPALAGPAPTRAMFVFIPDGCVPSLWHPTGSEFDFQLSPMLSPLQSVRDDFVFLSRVNMYEGDPTHEGGVAKVLTGVGPVSLDVFLGNQFAGETPVSSLYLGVGANYQNGGNYFSYVGNGKVRTPEDNPLTAFASVFGSVDGSPTPTRNTRASVLDAALGDLNSVRSKLGTAERAKLDLHLSALREVEGKIARDAPPSCGGETFNREGFTVPDGYHGYPPKYDREEHFELVGKLQTDLAVLALGCDMTRVVSFQWSHPVSPTRMKWSGSSQKYHDASHFGNPDSQNARDFVLMKQWYAEQLRYLVNSLRNRPDGDSNLLDNTIIFVFSDLGDSNKHDHRKMPFLLAGRAGGALRTGRLLDYDGDAHTKLLVSIANALGVNIDSFGYTGHGRGPLPGLLG